MILIKKNYLMNTIKYIENLFNSKNTYIKISES